MMLPDVNLGINASGETGTDFLVEHCLSPTQPQVAKLAYTYREAAEALGVSESTIKRMVDAGELKCITIAQRLKRIPAESLQRLLR